jgi:hypothetical protein
MTMHELYAQFGLDVMTIDFIGHALALHQNDAYMMQVGAAQTLPGAWQGASLVLPGWGCGVCRLPERT